MKWRSNARQHRERTRIRDRSRNTKAEVEVESGTAIEHRNRIGNLTGTETDVETTSKKVAPASPPKASLCHSPLTLTHAQDGQYLRDVGSGTK